MNENLKSKLEWGLRCGGYLTIVSDSIEERKKLIEDIKNELSQIEILSEYSLQHSELEIKEKLQNHSVMLINLEEKLEEDRKMLQKYHKTEISKEDSVYMSLIGYREYTKEYALILMCNSDTAPAIYCNNANLSSMAQNVIRLNKFRDIEDEER